MSLAKTFHPDKVGRRSPELVDLASKVFARISEANDVLSSNEHARGVHRPAQAPHAARRPTARRSPASSPPSSSSSARRTPCGAATGPPRSRRSSGRWSSIRTKASSTRCAAGCCSCSSRTRAREIRSRPTRRSRRRSRSRRSRPRRFYYLGQIRKACGDQAEAEKMFRKTIELRPDHVEAKRELRLIQMRRAKGDETVSGGCSAERRSSGRREDRAGLAQRQADRLGRRERPHPHPHAALRAGRVRGHPLLPRRRRARRGVPAEASTSSGCSTRRRSSRSTCRTSATRSRPRSSTRCARTAWPRATSARSSTWARARWASCRKDNPTQLAIIVWPWGAYLGDEGLERGIRAKVSSYTRHHPNVSLTKSKTCGDYVNSILAKREVTRQGYDEAIMLDTNGLVAECSGENIFIVRRGDAEDAAARVGARGHHARLGDPDRARQGASRSSSRASRATRSTAPTRCS